MKSGLAVGVLCLTVLCLIASNFMLAAQHSNDMERLRRSNAAMEELVRADAVLRDADTRLKANSDKLEAAEAELKDADARLHAACGEMAQRMGIRWQ